MVFQFNVHDLSSLNHCFSFFFGRLPAQALQINAGRGQMSYKAAGTPAAARTTYLSSSSHGMLAERVNVDKKRKSEAKDAADKPSKKKLKQWLRLLRSCTLS